ncbi:Retron-type RNA-directed DNA polymerase, partial [hydrothermal vent metagenome]
ECSFAYRKGRSVKKAVQKIIDYRERGYVWVVDADITSYFDEIDHEILLKEIRKYVDDERVIRLIRLWLESDVVYRGRRKRLLKGVPQGSPISPLLSNLYLDGFDETLMKARYKHVRFADDFIILCKERPDAEDALELTEDALKKLRLSLHHDKTRLVHFNDGFKYLGVEFLRSMIFRPIYEDKPEIDNEPVRPPIVAAREKTVITPRVSDLPDTAMAEAFKEALEESEEENLDSFFQERPEIEPSASKNPFLRTLYLLEQGSVLAKEDERFRILKDRMEIKVIPAIKVDQVLVFGNVQLTTQAMKFCLEKEIPVILLSSRGRYFGEISSFKITNVALHKRQFEMADNEALSLETGKAIIKAKINNSKVIIQRFGRKRKHLSFASEVQKMKLMLNRVSGILMRDELMGVEGAASAMYFSALRTLLGDEWGFRKRQKQPPPDPVNSLLSYGYTLLFYNIFAMVRMHGLHPYIGFLHKLRNGHPALVSDILEEFRAPVVDAVVISLILRGSIKKEDFLLPRGRGSPCLLKGDARKVFIRAFENKMNSSISHAPTGHQVDYRRCIDLQVQGLRQVIEGNMEEYKPMMIK